MHVLIVDDCATLRALITRVLRQDGFAEISEAGSAEEMYDQIGLGNSNVKLFKSVELILLDIGLPGISGIDACRRIKSDTRFKDVPIVMVTASSDMALLQQSFEAGASDYITKPVHPVELLARIGAIKRLQAEMQKRRAREEELLRVKGELEQLSSLDSLTGIFNRRRFDEVLQREWHRARRKHQALSVTLVDIDYFKTYNDTYGHQLGDACLTAVARKLQDAAKRSSDFVARYGGDEFAAISVDREYNRAIDLGRLLAEAVATLQLEHKASNISPFVTVSVGIATTTPAPDKEPKQLFEQADRALYESKAAGRNRVTHSRELLSEPMIRAS